MTFGEASDGNVKVVAVLLSDELDEVDGVVEAVFWGDPFALALGRVTSEGENVVAARLVSILWRGREARNRWSVRFSFSLCDCYCTLESRRR